MFAGRDDPARHILVEKTKVGAFRKAKCHSEQNAVWLLSCKCSYG